MSSRSAFTTAGLVVLVAVSLPAGAYFGASNLGPIAGPSGTQGDDPYSEMCIPPSPLENITMNASRQEAANLSTTSAVVSSTGNGTTIEDGLLTIESEYIEGSELCFDRLSTENETMQIRLHDVRFNNTSIHGPWTDIEFGSGTADGMTVVLPGEELLNVLRQTPEGRLLIDGITDRYDLSSARNETGQTGDEGSAGGSDESVRDETDRDDGSETGNGTDANGLRETVRAVGSGIGDASRAIETTMRKAVDRIETLTGPTAGSDESGSEPGGAEPAGR